MPQRYMVFWEDSWTGNNHFVEKCISVKCLRRHNTCMKQYERQNTKETIFSGYVFETQSSFVVIAADDVVMLYLFFVGACL